jgi:Cdc6-like AAA superfamily ATPase
MPVEPENRWLRFGLATNPYFPEALSPDEAGPRPISLFRGREEQVKNLADTVASEESSLILVEGASGTGKSTLLHYVKHVLRGPEDQPRYFAPSAEIGVQSDSTAQNVLVQVIDSIVRHASDLAPQTDWQREFPAIHKTRSMVEAIQTLGTSWTLGGTLPGGPGASLGRTRSTSTSHPQLGPVLSPAFFSELANEIRQITTPPMEGVVIQVNNMDVLMARDPKTALRLFGDLRDHFHVPGMHWAFLGPPGLYEEAVAPEKRVKDFLKTREILEPLPINDVHAILKARYEHYKVDSKYIKPSEDDLVGIVYDQFGGDLRGALNALTLAHRHYSPIDVKPLQRDHAVQVLAEDYRTALEQDLREKTLTILKHLIETQQHEFTQDDATPVEKHQSNRSIRFSELVAHDAVRLTRNEGARKIYTFGGKARMAYGAP